MDFKSEHEAFIRSLYRGINFSDKIPVVWVSSPAVGAILAPILAHENPITQRVIDRAKRHAELFVAGKAKEVMQQYKDALSHANKSGAGAYTSQPGGNAVSRITRGSNPATPIVIRALAEDTRSLLHKTFERRVRYYMYAFSPTLIVYWPNKRFVVVPEAPKHMLRNNNRQFHSTTQKAIQWADGWGVCAINGVLVPNPYIEQPSTLTVKEIKRERNVEVKRALIELMGYEQWLKESAAILLHKDYDYDGRVRNLWKLDEQLNVIEVFNSTPELDGSHKKYFLQIPSHIRTIQDGLYWMLDATTETRPIMRIET